MTKTQIIETFLKNAEEAARRQDQERSKCLSGGSEYKQGEAAGESMAWRKAAAFLRENMGKAGT